MVLEPKGDNTMKNSATIQEIIKLLKILSLEQ
jgi:hypothetical protein